MSNLADETLPAWATATSCVTAACTDCSDPFGDDDEGTTWHFEDLTALRRAIDDDDDDDDRSWQVVGDALLCRQCAANRVCAAQGHQWTHHESFLSAFDPDRVVPEYWSCARVCKAGSSKTDPTVEGAA